jgi:hypothetical protein
LFLTASQPSLKSSLRSARSTKRNFPVTRSDSDGFLFSTRQ